ncbi:MAG: hypothetical protein K0Q64_897 [Nitrobacter vulgaris]|nr:hypothetical protein [Nitrobacter vulgaris]
MFVAELERAGLFRGGEIERHLVRCDDRSLSLFLPVARGQFATIEGEHGRHLGGHRGVCLPVIRRRVAGGSGVYDTVWSRQAVYIGTRLEILRQGKWRDPDVDSGFVVIESS